MEEKIFLHIISKKTAKKLKMVRYFTGEPCAKGHITERYTNSAKCIQCSKESYNRFISNNPDYHSNWHLKNHKEVIKRHRQWKKDNPNYNKEYYYNMNRDEVNAYCKKRYRDIPEVKAAKLIRGYLERCLKLTGNDKITNTESMLGYSAKDFRQHTEQRMLFGMTWENFGEWHLDHLHPIARYVREGEEDVSIVNRLDNLAPMWAMHNQEKGNKTLEEWLSEKGENSEEYRLYGHYLNKE